MSDVFIFWRLFWVGTFFFVFYFCFQVLSFLTARSDFNLLFSEPLFIFESSFWFYLYIGITFPFLWLQYSIDFLFFQYVILAKLLYSHLCNRENLAFISQKALTFIFILWYDLCVERFNFEPLFCFYKNLTALECAKPFFCLFCHSTFKNINVFACSYCF